MAESVKILVEGTTYRPKNQNELLTNVGKEEPKRGGGGTNSQLNPLRKRKLNPESAKQTCVRAL